ncbi:MAG: ABC transporter permease [Anaerolineaceae bacterium]|nr:ABC transporter permease [Anaerolineaceae bacterium]
MYYLAWRNLKQSRTQFILGVGGVALALLLMLSLDALLAGSEEDLVAYIEQSGADIFVSQEGVKNMHMAYSAITWRDLALARRASGVVSASPILYTTTVLKTEEADILSYVIGFDPDEPLGGPAEIAAGTAIIDPDEVIVDEAVARAQNLTLGDKVEVLGQTFTIVGLTRGLTNIVNSISFIHIQDFQKLRGDEVISYALLDVAPDQDVAEVAAVINGRNDRVLAISAADFSREERQIIKDMSVEILNIMNLSGFLIGLAVTALTLYTNTLRKRQEYGVLKAIGAKNRHLYTVVAVQAALSLVLGFVAAVSLVWLLGLLVPFLSPGMGLTLTQTGVTRVLAASLVIGIFAALVPAWQLARLDPAEVFRG